ncbi:MAG: hypothetical protein KDD50_13535, partial [Bdellovibrionales bacterium]|nr:hypothetical protein [Bdellovibrionales bacterium]
GDRQVLLSGTLVINNDFSLVNTCSGTCEIRSGSIELKGNLYSTSSVSSLNSSTTSIKLVGNNTQEISGSGAFLPLEINTTGTINILNDVKILTQLYKVAGTLNINAHKVSLVGASFLGSSNELNVGNTQFQDLSIEFIHGFTRPINIIGDVVVNGNLDLLSQCSGDCQYTGGGKFKVSGDITLNKSTAIIGTVDIELNGNNSQKINYIAGVVPKGTWTINKPSGTVVLNSSINLSNSGQDLVLTSGSIDLNGYDLTVNDNLSTDFGTSISENCGLLSYATHSPANGTLYTSTSSPEVNIRKAVVQEGGNLIFNVYLSEPVCATNFTVNYATSDGTATLSDSDYTNTSGTLTIAAKALSASITVPTTSDSTDEADESLLMTLSSPSHGSLKTSAMDGVILDNDDVNFTWTGTSSSDFSDGSNWSGGVVPGTNDVIIFNEACAGNTCDIVSSSNIDVKGIRFLDTFSGTLTQSSGHTFTIGSEGWIQTAGTFLGGNSAITINGNFDQFGGQFTSTSGTLSVGYYVAGVNNLNGFNFNSGTFIHNSGKVMIKHSGNYGSSKDAGRMTIDNSLTLYDFEVDIDDLSSTSGYNGARLGIYGRPHLVVENAFIFKNGQINGSPIDLLGSLEVYCTDGESGQSCAGGGATELNILTNQTYKHQGDGKAPYIVVKNGATFSPEASTTSFRVEGLDLQNGVFTAPTGIFKISDIYLDSSKGLLVSSISTYSHNNGQLVLDASASAQCVDKKAMTIDVPTNLNLYDLTVDITATAACSGIDYQGAALEIVSGDTITVEHDLTLTNGKINSGQILVNGNLDVQCPNATQLLQCPNGGSANITMNGSSNATINYASSAILPGGTLTIDKSSAQVDLVSNFEFNSAGQSLNILSGILDTTNYTMTINNDVSVTGGGGANILCSGTGTWSLGGVLTGSPTCSPTP